MLGGGGHEDFLSMAIAGAAHIGVVEQRRLAAVLGRRLGPPSWAAALSRFRARREATLLQLSAPSSRARAETASTWAGSTPR
jgi:hypothetical protein